MAPFGPTMGYFKMPNEMVDYLNNSIDKKLDDFSDYYSRTFLIKI